MTDSAAPEAHDDNGVRADADIAEDAEVADELPFQHRSPWKYVIPICLLALVWLVIGLICSPVYFRF